ncbi:hypothetical protein AURDEDRAFT_166522 [Auricularia subglabra TFB-10046 SS5]|nr:hypothetical protein AURDEDRAFT_166522 [Auricularia subglabra TFB-10046 SS5]
MLAADYDSTALRALLVSDAKLLSRDITEAAQLAAIIEHLCSTTQSILSDFASSWNARNPSYNVPDESLAACFSFLPLRDRVAVSHVSRAWRHAALEFPLVWYQLDIFSASRGPASLFEMALSRAGRLAVELTYVEREHALVTMAQAVERNIHRIRSISWNSNQLDTHFPTLTGPAPLLESLITNVDPKMPEGFLGGLIGRLHAMHVPLFNLPSSCAALSTVTCLQGSVPITDGADTFSRLFKLFPQLDFVSLLGLDDSLTTMPSGPIPLSLAYLRLMEHVNGHCNLVAQYLTWRTETLRQCDLWFPVPRAVRPTPSLCHLFAGASEISITMPPDGKGESEIALVDSMGRICRIICHRHHTHLAAFKAYGRLLAGVSLDCVRTLRLDSMFLADICRLHPPQLAHLALYIQRVDIKDGQSPPSRGSFPWDSLNPMAELGELYPKLNSLSVEIYAADADDARELMHVLSTPDLRGLPTIHVHGFPSDFMGDVEEYARREGPIKVTYGINY